MDTEIDYWAELNEVSSTPERELKHLLITNRDLRDRVDRLEHELSTHMAISEAEIKRITNQSEMAILECEEHNLALLEENEGLKSMVQHYQTRVDELTRDYLSM